MATLDQLHAAARHAIVKQDEREQRSDERHGGRANIYGLGLKLGVLDKAREHAETKLGDKSGSQAGDAVHAAFKAGVSEHFNDRLHGSIQKAVDKTIAGPKVPKAKTKFPDDGGAGDRHDAAIKAWITRHANGG